MATSQNRGRARRLEPRHGGATCGRRAGRQTRRFGRGGVCNGREIDRSRRDVGGPSSELGSRRTRFMHSSSGRARPTSWSSAHAVSMVSAPSEASVSESHTRRTAPCLSSTSNRRRPEIVQRHRLLGERRRLHPRRSFASTASRTRSESDGARSTSPAGRPCRHRALAARHGASPPPATSYPCKERCCKRRSTSASS